MREYTGLEIAVIGMSGRFPGAEDLNKFWDNLKNGVESIQSLSDEELIKEGENKYMIDNPLYVKASSYLDNKEYFDSAFFNYRPDEAKLMDPQMRIFHECVWAALEDAGYNVFEYKGKIGLFAGATPNLNWEVYSSLINNKDSLVDGFSELLLRNIGFINTRISYYLNLRGPSIFLNTACSTSLVSIQQACKSLLTGECNIAIAGGITIKNHSKKGYLYQDGMVGSKDGHCRTFDEQANGTVIGEGAGVVVLKTLKNAIKDRDNIMAIIIGSGVNNDGNNKVGYTAPAVDGQTEVIMMAHKWAKIEPESISYVETHGTATKLGDPIEIEALSRAFGKSKTNYCAIGSVKTNIGHADSAAGVAGLIKTVLSLKHKQIPASINFTTPNPKIDFNNTPFYVNTELKEWKNDKYPLRAGVSAFGIGGTNAHIVLEEAPEMESSSESREYQLLTFSAKTSAALQRNIDNLKDYLKENVNTKLSDIAYTLQVGRASFTHRKVYVCDNREGTIELLSDKLEDMGSVVDDKIKPTIVFMFTGAGSQYVNMYNDLYLKEKIFRQEVDNCFNIVKRLSGKELKTIIFPSNDLENVNQINDIEYLQPAIFVMEYALARLLMKWGVNPDVLIGHSFGEYVAACISGVFSLEDALFLILKRGEVMQKTPKGSMLSISISESKLNTILDNHKDISVAAINSSEACVVSGSEDSIIKIKSEIEQIGYDCKLINVSVAGHSYLMDGVLDEFEKEVSRVKINPQQIPFISNISGKKADDIDISNPKYWVKHLRQPVRFSEGIESLLANKNSIFIEVGPGKVLSTFVGANKLKGKEHKVINLVRHPKELGSDIYYLLLGLGKIWMNGKEPQWNSFYENEIRRRVSLPTYSFDKIKYPVHVDSSKMIFDMISDKSIIKSNDLADWFHTPSWEITPFISNKISLIEKKCNVIFIDDCGIGDELNEKFEQNGERAIRIKKGKQFSQKNDYFFEINPELDDDYVNLFKAIGDKESFRIIFNWGISDVINEKITVEKIEKSLNDCFYSLLNIVKAIGCSDKNSNIEIVAITNNLHYVLNTDYICPEKSPLLGVLKVIPKEYTNIIKSQNIDIILSEKDDKLIKCIFNEITSNLQNNSVVYRNKTRFTETVKSISLPKTDVVTYSFIAGGVYLITGGIGGMGLSIVKQITSNVKGVNFILLGRKNIPSKSEWKSWLNIQNKDNPLYNTIMDLQLIEENGGYISYYSVDIADKKKLEKVIVDAEEKLGSIRGVIHAAGVADYGGVIYRRTKEDDEKTFAAKIYGTIILNDILSTHNLDFFILCSSLVTFHAPFGEVGYTSANIFLDSFSKYNSIINNSNMISIGWNVWKGVGMAIKMAENNEKHEIPFDSISPEEGYEVILRSLTSNIHEVLISKVKLSELSDINSKQKILFNENFDTELGTNELIPTLSLTSAEEKLIVIWQKFFGKTEINIDDDFFEIGGDSLKALTLIQRIHKVFDVELSIVDIFKKPSIRKLSDCICSKKSDENGNKKYVSIPKVDFKEHYVLSSAQKRLYFIYEFDKQSIAYHITQVVILEGVLYKEKLINAFNKLLERHESLRTSFEIVSDQVVQKISDQVKFEVECFNSDEKNVPQIINNFIRPFDLSKAPLIRVGFIETSPQKNILMVDKHHIITDGISHGILIRELMALYNNDALPEIELQYKDYAEWQQSDELQVKSAEQRAFWLNEFADEVTTLNLPTDFKRPSTKSYEGSAVFFSLSTEDTSSLKSIAETNGATMFHVLLSIYNILLSKLSNQKDIVVGTPVAGRGHVDLENMIGMFVNTLPLRNYPKGELSFREFLLDVKNKILDCFNNQTYQYEDLVDELKMARNLGRNPLFDVMIVLLNFEIGDLKIPGLKLNGYNIGHRTSKFDLLLEVLELQGQIFLTFEYSTELFRKETIEKFIEYFRKIVLIITMDQGKIISDIEIISENEKQQLLYGLNETKAIYPQNKTIHELFEEQVNRTPNDIALVFDEKEMTYRELNERSNQFARLLVKKGVQTEDVVGVMIDRSFEMIIGIFGILKSGGACLPIDPEYPEDRINDIIELSKPKIILSSKKQIANKIETIVIDQQIEVFDSSNLELNIQSNNLIYIIYTSGSTGKPKGVMLEHKNIVNLIIWAQKNTKITYDKVLQFATLSFDMSFHEIFSALLNGGSLFLINEALRMDASRLLKYIDENKISSLWLPTAYLKYVLNSGEFTTILPSKVAHIITAGEQLIVSDYLREYLRENNICLYNFYGPSETHVITAFTMNSDEYIADIPSIGMPISNTSIFIVDNCMRINPIGVEGELIVSGDQVGRGYLYREDLTNEKFIYWDPETGKTYSKENKSAAAIRVYRTGDICRWLPDGNIEFFGRIDHQVKIRGFRVELGEIETILLKHKKIKEAIVIVRGEKGEKNLCAYIVSEEEFDIAELKTYLSQSLPDYMLPSYYVRLESMPLTPNGKINKKVLPEPEVAAGDYYIVPSNDIEEKLVAIWSEVLKIDKEQISIDKNFFELGGHSLRAMILVNKIHKEFNINVALKEIFNKPTIESFADFIITLKQLDSNCNINNNEKIKEVII